MLSLEKISKNLSDLRSTYNSLNVEGLKLDKGKIEKLKNDLKSLESEFSKVSVKGEVQHLVSSIQQSLTKLERGLNDTDSIKDDAEKANNVINSYTEVKKDIESFSGDIETLERDAYEESRNASVVGMLDKVATVLEEKGLRKEAEILDEISNTLESSYKKG